MGFISLNEFRARCAKLKPATFIFDTTNQSYTNSPWVSTVLKCSDILITSNPNRVCLKDESTTVCFNMVKSIWECKPTISNSAEFIIICGNQSDDKSNFVFVIIADQESKEPPPIFTMTLSSGETD